MNSCRHEDFTEMVLALFRAHGSLIDWGNNFVAPFELDKRALANARGTGIIITTTYRATDRHAHRRLPPRRAKTAQFTRRGHLGAQVHQSKSSALSPLSTHPKWQGFLRRYRTAMDPPCRNNLHRAGFLGRSINQTCAGFSMRGNTPRRNREGEMKTKLHSLRNMASHPRTDHNGRNRILAGKQTFIAFVDKKVPTNADHCPEWLAAPVASGILSARQGRCRSVRHIFLQHTACRINNRSAEPGPYKFEIRDGLRVSGRMQR